MEDIKLTSETLKLCRLVGFGTELKNAVKGMKFLRSDLYGSDLGMISVTTV